MPAGTTAAAKAVIIQKAFIAAGVPAADAIVVGTEVRLIGFQMLASKVGSGEVSSFTYGTNFSDPTGPTVAALGFELASGSTSLSGVDSMGAVADYRAGFTFDDPIYGAINLSADLTFNELSSPTIAGLLNDEYTLLSSELSVQAPSRTDLLSIDNSADAIELTFPLGVTNGSVTDGSTDVSVLSGAGVVAVVPEPSTWCLLMFGLAGLSLAQWRSCRASVPRQRQSRLRHGKACGGIHEVGRNEDRCGLPHGHPAQ
jgi:PEP-CTERM motif-containing protein